MNAQPLAVGNTIGRNCPSVTRCRFTVAHISFNRSPAIHWSADRGHIADRGARPDIAEGRIGLPSGVAHGQEDSEPRVRLARFEVPHGERSAGTTAGRGYEGVDMCVVLVVNLPGESA